MIFLVAPWHYYIISRSDSFQFNKLWLQSSKQFSTHYHKLLMLLPSLILFFYQHDDQVKILCEGQLWSTDLLELPIELDQWYKHKIKIWLKYQYRTAKTVVLSKKICRNNWMVTGICIHRVSGLRWQ
jgi:hypothetical protein